MYIYISIYIRIYQICISTLTHILFLCFKIIDLPCISPPCHHPIIWEKIPCNEPTSSATTGSPWSFTKRRLPVLPENVQLNTYPNAPNEWIIYLHECLYIYIYVLMVDVGKYIPYIECLIYMYIYIWQPNLQ